MSNNLIHSNNIKGKFGEIIAKEDYENHGFKIIPVNVGADFIAVKKIGTKLNQVYVEVKTGRSRQTKKQKRKMREVIRKGKEYTIYRVTEVFLEHYIMSDGRTIL